MRTLLLSLFILVSCAHQETTEVTVRANSITLSAPDIAHLLKTDIDQMERATESRLPRIVPISEKRKAYCQPGKCKVTKAKENLFEVTGKDLSSLSILMQAAKLSKKEEIRKDGPVTWKCLPTRCSADVFIETDPFETTTKVNYTVDYTAPFLSSILGGLFSLHH